MGGEVKYPWPLRLFDGSFGGTATREDLRLGQERAYGFHLRGGSG